MLPVVPLVAISLAACDSDVLGIIGETNYDEPWLITSPDTVAAGVAFHVTFVTMGANCINTAARTEVRVRANVAEIRPYDTGDSRACCGVACRGPATISHQADVTVIQVGPATLRVFGASDRHIDKAVWVK